MLFAWGDYNTSKLLKENINLWIGCVVFESGFMMEGKGHSFWGEEGFKCPTMHGYWSCVRRKEKEPG